MQLITHLVLEPRHRRADAAPPIVALALGWDANARRS